MDFSAAVNAQSLNLDAISKTKLDIIEMQTIQGKGWTGAAFGGLSGTGTIGTAIGATAGYVIEERHQNYQANQAEGAATNNPSNKDLERNAKESRELADSWWR